MATIGIDTTALSISASGGIGTAQYQTMRALAQIDLPHRFLLYATSPPVVPFSKERLDLPWPVRFGSGLLARSNIVWMQSGVNHLLAEDHVDVFWGPRHLLPFRAHGISKVATVHDFWDRYYPDQQPWLNRRANRWLIKRVISDAEVVVTPSIATARDAERFYGALPGSLHVVQWGVDPTVFKRLSNQVKDSVLARLEIQGPYLLSLDVFNPRKNFSAVLEGVAQLPENVRRPLTVIGLGRPREIVRPTVDLQARAASLGLDGGLRLLGEVSLGDLVALYSGALALVCPSLYEGFGMPVLEAMACGCPVITSDCSSLPEVAGDAALLVDPASAQQLSQAIALLATDPWARSRLAAAGKKRAEGFTWHRAAEKMVAAFEQALAMRVGSTGANA